MYLCCDLHVLETSQDFNIWLVDVYNVKDNGLLAGVTLPLSSCAPRFFLAPKIPLSLPLRTPARQAINV